MVHRIGLEARVLAALLAASLTTASLGALGLLKQREPKIEPPLVTLQPVVVNATQQQATPAEMGGTVSPSIAAAVASDARR